MIQIIPHYLIYQFELEPVVLIKQVVQEKIVSMTWGGEKCFCPVHENVWMGGCCFSAVLSFISVPTERMSSLLFHFLLLPGAQTCFESDQMGGVECLPMTTGREKVHQALWQPFTSTLCSSSLINRESISRLLLMVRGEGALCLDQSERRDLKVAHRVLETALEHSSSRWHRLMGLQNKLDWIQSGPLCSTKRFDSFGESQIFNWLLHDNLWLLSGNLISMTVKKKEKTCQRRMEKAKNPKGVYESRMTCKCWSSYLSESLTQLKFMCETGARYWQWDINYSGNCPAFVVISYRMLPVCPSTSKGINCCPDKQPVMTVKSLQNKIQPPCVYFETD